MGAMLLAVHEFCGKDRPFVTGVFVTLALLTRPTAAFTAVFFVLPLMRRGDLKKTAMLLTPPIVGVAFLGAYNCARFGDALDFCYSRMYLTGWGREMMARYGQFHPHFIPINAFYFFVAPLWSAPAGGFLGIGYDPLGLGLFVGSPLTLYALVGLVRGRKNQQVTDAAIGVAVCVVPLLLYFNTGYWQFGHRFCQDYLPMLMILMIAGMTPGRWTGPIALTALSIGIQAVGVFSDPVTQLPAWLTPSQF